MLTVHHLGLSQSERIVWLCEELEIPYAFKRYDRRADNRLAPDEYKALHPMGIAPVVTDGALALGESGAIVDYICARYGAGRLIPKPDDPDFADHLFWFHWSNGTFMTTLMMQLILSAGGDGAANLNNSVEALMLSGVGVGVANASLTDAAAVATAFNNAYAITANNGEDALLVVNDTDGNDFSVWSYVQAGGGEITAAELTLIGVFHANGNATTSNFELLV